LYGFIVKDNRPSHATFDDYSVATEPNQSVSDLLLAIEGVEYHYTHDHDIHMATRRLSTGSEVAPDICAPLYSLLISGGKIFRLPNEVLPKQLQRKRSVCNFEVSVGKHKGIIRKELGRGAYGVIFLVICPGKEEDNAIAVKVQTPTDSLAWEFEVLQRLEHRMSLHFPGGWHGFPRPLSFISLADGGIMSMTAASVSGLNLVDLSNFYKLTLGEPVPEIIAMHYTSLALMIIEKLHCCGKILVRIQLFKRFGPICRTNFM
jgi:hypothetical protein